MVAVEGAFPGLIQVVSDVAEVQIQRVVRRAPVRAGVGYGKPRRERSRVGCDERQGTLSDAEVHAGGEARWCEAARVLVVHRLAVGHRPVVVVEKNPRHEPRLQLPFRALELQEGLHGVHFGTAGVARPAEGQDLFGCPAASQAGKARFGEFVSDAAEVGEVAHDAGEDAVDPRQPRLLRLPRVSHCKYSLPLGDESLKSS